MAPSCSCFTALKRIKKLKNKQSQDKFRSRTSNQLTEEAAAIRIQSAIRGYRVRRMYWRLKGILRFQGDREEETTVKKQAVSALSRIDLWRRIQVEIKCRRVGMVAESLQRRIKLEKKTRLEARLHELEVEWCNDTNSLETMLHRIRQREEAADRRERAMAYAFTHQWRPNSSKDLGRTYFNLSKESWGWSWKHRWVAIRPWQTRCHTSLNLDKKTETNHNTSATRKQIFPRGITSDAIQGRPE